jgi:hypothetical protein
MNDHCNSFMFTFTFTAVVHTCIGIAIDIQFIRVDRRVSHVGLGVGTPKKM